MFPIDSFAKFYEMIVSGVDLQGFLNNLQGNVGTMIMITADFVIAFISTMTSLFLGLIFSIYFLASKEIENIFENSDFILMLSQGSEDKEILAKHLNISNEQLAFVTHAGVGQGLLFYGDVILPFEDHFPKELELYQIMTTKMSEVYEQGEQI